MIMSKIHAGQLGGAWKLIAGRAAWASNVKRLARGETGKGSGSNLNKVLVNSTKLLL